MPFRPAYPGEVPSLGWDLIDLWAELFPSPRDEAEPLVLTDEQALQIVEWYSLHPVTGKFVYRRGCSRRAKGVGKSPIEGAKCISELALPVRFAGWSSEGRPVGRPWGTMGDPLPWVQIAALSEDQDANTYSPLFYFLTANNGRVAEALNIDAGVTRCVLRGHPGAKIEPVTSKAGSREGQPITYGCLDETGMMTPSNGGVKLALAIRRNATKMGGRSYETTNGYRPGEGSVAEETDKAVMAGTGGILYDAAEAPAQIDGIDVTRDAPDWVLRRALAESYGQASMDSTSRSGVRGWVDLDRTVADISDPDMPWDEVERFFLNWNRKGETQGVDPEEWRLIGRPERIVTDGEHIGLGFDGSISQDATALIGCTQDGHLFEIHVWERPVNAPPGWRIPRLEVERKIEETFERFRVGRMLCDPPKWQTEIERWMERWNAGRRVEDAVVVFFDTNQPRRMSPACDRFGTAITEAASLSALSPDAKLPISHDGSSLLTAHVLAMAKAKAKARDPEGDGRTLYVFTKADDGRKIDAGIGAVLALEAAMTMPELPADTVPLVAWR